MSDVFGERDDDYEVIADKVIEERDAAFSDFLNIAPALKNELKKGGPFAAYLAEMRKEAIKHVQRIVDVDPHDVAAIMEIKTAIAAYTTAAVFATTRLRAYSEAVADSEGSELEGSGEDGEDAERPDRL